MLKFKSDTNLQIIEGYDEITDNITEDGEQLFKKNELVDANVYSRDGKYCDIQFGDGSIAMGVLRSSFIIVKKPK